MEPTWRFDDYTIWIPQTNYDVEDSNIDIHVTLKTGERYGATLITLKNIHTLMERGLRTGDNNDGQYFWMSDPVIVLDLTDKTILDLVAHLVKSGNIKKVFDHYRDDKKPNFGEINSRLREDIKRYGGTMPEHAAIAWHGYLASLLEYGFLLPEWHQELSKRLPPLSDNSILDVFLSKERSEGELMRYYPHGKPTFEGLWSRIQEDIKHYGNPMPERAALVWDGYLAALIEWGLTSVYEHYQLADLLPYIEDNPVRSIYLGWPEPGEEEE